MAFTLRLDPDLEALIDQHRGDVSRARWITRQLEAAVGTSRLELATPASLHGGVDRFRQHGVIPASEVATGAKPHRVRIDDSLPAQVIPSISAAPILRVDEAKRNVKPIPKAGKK